MVGQGQDGTSPLCPKKAGAQCGPRPSTLAVNDLGGQEAWGLRGRKQRGDQTCLGDQGWDSQGEAQGSDTAAPTVAICSRLAVLRGWSSLRSGSLQGSPRAWCLLRAGTEWRLAHARKEPAPCCVLPPRKAGAGLHPLSPSSPPKDLQPIKLCLQDWLLFCFKR